jgi:hypothetical protein
MWELGDSLELFASVFKALLDELQSRLHFLQHHCEGESLSNNFSTVFDAL